MEGYLQSVEHSDWCTASPYYTMARVCSIWCQLDWKEPGHGGKHPTLQRGPVSLRAFVFHHLYLFIYLCVCMHVDSYIPQHVCGCQRTTCRNWFSPLTTWAPRVNLKFSGLAAFPVFLDPCVHMADAVDTHISSSLQGIAPPTPVGIYSKCLSA